jgi:hypothetical protein
MPRDGLSEYKDFGSSNDWHQRLLVMLEGARLWVRREEEANEPSPVQFVYISKIVKAAGQQPGGEPRLCFTVAPISSQEQVEAVFAPHKAQLVVGSFHFSIPLSFFDHTGATGE